MQFMAHPVSFLVLVLLSLSILYIFLLIWTNRRLNKKVSASGEPELLPPGPDRLPVIGNLHQLVSEKNLHRYFWELSNQHGPILYLKLGRVPTLVISSAATAKQVLKTHDVDCSNRHLSIPTLKITYDHSDVAFAPYGERWKELRRICMEEYLSHRKVASLRSVVEEDIYRTMKLVASRMKGSPTAVVDISDTCCFLINSIICATAYGSSHHDDGRENTRFLAIQKEAQAMVGGFFLGDYLPMLGWVDVLTGMRGRLRRTFFQLDSFYQQLIKAREGINHRRGNMLDSLLHVQRNTKNLTQDEIKALLNDVFVAGTGAPTALMEWTMTELMRHPEAMKRVQDEVRDCVGRKGKVEESDLCQLRYLKAVMKETMRLHPPTPLVPRESIRGFKLQGYDVAPKTTVFINAFAIGRDPMSWERPDEFLPERFMNDEYSTCSTDLNNHHDFKLLTFGEGRRICPGISLGLLMVELGLANLLYCFDWSLPAGMAAVNIDMGEAPGISVHRSTSLRLVATKYDAFHD